MTRNEWRNDLIDFIIDCEPQSEDEFHDCLMENIDNMVIYTHDCKNIVHDLDYDIFQEHDVWGRAENWSQAAFAALYDLFIEGDFTFEDIKNYGNN